MIVHSRNGGTLLIVSAFAFWITALGFFHKNELWGLAAAHAIGACSFLAVACFLPDLQRAAFYSRKSALGAVGFFSYISVIQLPYFTEWIFADQKNPSLGAILFLTLPIILASGVYWLSFFAIRGFRANREYETEGEQNAAGQSATRSELK
jgi:bacteriorhodopsin